MTHPTIGSVAKGDTEAAMVTPEMTKAALAAYRLNARSMIQTRSLDVYETELMHRVITAALSTRPAQEPVAWRWKFDPEGKWSYGDNHPGNFRFGDPEIIEPVYAAPQPVLSQPEVKAEADDAYLAGHEEGRREVLHDFGSYWRCVEDCPEDEHVILAVTGGHVGEAIMLIDEDTGRQKWTWALGPVHPNHIPLGWQPMPKPIIAKILPDTNPGGFDGPTGAD